MEKVVKKVRRHGEAYDVVRTADGKLVNRPVDAPIPKPTAAKPEKPGPTPGSAQSEEN